MIKISNQKMRLLWLKSTGLQNTNKQKFDLLQIIKDLGFVQLDTIQNVSRAHHHILWSRDKRYKEHMLDKLLLEKGNIFEHFTHDASILPVEFYPVWKLQFENIKEKIDRSKYYKDIFDEDEKKELLHKIKDEGALNIKDFETNTKNDKKMWSRSVCKNTLEYMWYCGLLTTAHRQSFRKYYDLIENIIPKDTLNKKISKKEQIHILCTEALDKMSIASPKEIKEFWDVLNITDVNTWIEENKQNLQEVQWQNSEGKYLKSFATLDIEHRLDKLKNSKAKIQIINPFDPAIRDRKRTKSIFGFDYKIEIFVPKEKRLWGYYVYPLLQGDKFVARIELQANRKENLLNVISFWKEPNTIWDDKQKEKLDIELKSFASLAGISEINWN